MNNIFELFDPTVRTATVAEIQAIQFRRIAAVQAEITRKEEGNTNLDIDLVQTTQPVHVTNNHVVYELDKEPTLAEQIGRVQEEISGLILPPYSIA